MKYLSLAKLTLVFLLLGAVFSRSEYKVTNVDKTLSTITLNLQYTGKDDTYMKENNPIIKELKFVFHMHAFYDFYVKITDANKQRFEVPQHDPFIVDPLASFSFPINLSGVLFEYSSQPFDFKIIRKINNAVIFSTYDSDFVYSEHLLQIGSEVDTKFIYGLGERFQSNFRKTEGKWTIFNRDRGQVIDTGVGRQTYGHYPVYFAK
jgi:alpha-glucosidase